MSVRRRVDSLLAPRWRALRLALLTPLLVAAGCGGKVVVDGAADDSTSSSTSTSTSGSGASGSGTSSSGTGGDACDGVQCNTPPSTCYELIGSCSQGACTYAPTTGGACDDGDACTTGDTCASGICGGSVLACSTPPANECLSSTTLRQYAATGICAVGACDYLPADTTCIQGCSAGACLKVPVSVTLAAGESQTCAIVSGGLHCWGLNSFGGLGDGTTNGSSVPVGVVGLASGVAAVGVANGYFSCALTTSGAVLCWGLNSNGSLGDGTAIDSLVPVPVAGLASGVVALSTGSLHACAVTAAGVVTCWGSNGSGQLGNSAFLSTSLPVDVKGVSSVVAVGAGEGHTCALTSTGAVKCWGTNDAGQLGNGTTFKSSTPVDVIGLQSGVVAIAAGAYHNCAVLVGGGLKCWGYGSAGQLGAGSQQSSSIPLDVANLSSPVASVAVGASHTCAILTSGAVKCWGYNEYGQLGSGSPGGISVVPLDVVGLSSAATVAALGLVHTCVGLADGKVACWGGNGVGQLGNGSTTSTAVPTEVVGL